MNATIPDNIPVIVAAADKIDMIIWLLKEGGRGKADFYFIWFINRLIYMQDHNGQQFTNIW